MGYDRSIENFVCSNTHLRIVNQIIYKEYIKNIEGNSKKEWAKNASKNLMDNYGISASDITLKRYLKQIQCGTRNPIASSSFISDEKKCASRYEKDMMHSQIDIFQNIFINEKTHYVGLPANQILNVSKKYNSVFAIEKNHEMFNFMNNLHNHIGNKKYKIHIINDEIFHFLETTEEKFNIFDLDLMTYMSNNLISKIAHCILRTSMDRAIVSITTIGGRKITTKQYKSLMPQRLISSLEGFKILCKPFSGGYKDHKMPMVYEIFAIEKKHE